MYEIKKLECKRNKYLIAGLFLSAELLILWGAYLVFWGRSQWYSFLGLTIQEVDFIQLLLIILVYQLGKLLVEGYQSLISSHAHKWKILSVEDELKAYRNEYHQYDFPLSITTYRNVLILPIILLVVIPMAIGFAAQIPFMVIVCTLLLGSFTCDLIILWNLREYHPDCIILSHPSKKGCVVLIPEE